MHTLSILLKSSWQGWLNSIRYASEDRRKKVTEVVGFLVLMTALYLIGHAIFKVVGQQTDADGQTLLRAINICVSLGVFILVKSAMEATIKQLIGHSIQDITVLIDILFMSWATPG